MIVSRKKRLWTPSRRSFLRGFGASIAAPYVAKAQFSEPGFGVSGFGNSVSSGSSPAPVQRAFVDWRAVDAASVYAFAGGMVVTDINTLFVADPSVGTTFDTANISLNGLALDQPSFIGAFLSDLFDSTGFTFLLTFDAIFSESNRRLGLECGDSSNYNHEMDCVAGSGASLTYIYNDAHQFDQVGNQFTAGSPGKIAVTMTPTAMAISVNGNAAQTKAPEFLNSYSSLAIANLIFGGSFYYQTYTIYDPVDDAALAVLSTLP